MKKVNSDVAYEYIRKKILSGEYPLGYPLVTEALSAETKVGRRPFREALHSKQRDWSPLVHVLEQPLRRWM